jgi:hypothetical protein
MMCRSVAIGAIAFATISESSAQTVKWILGAARFSDSEYWSYSDVGSGAEARLQKEADPGEELLQAVRTSQGTPVLVLVVMYDGMDNTGITLRVQECRGTVGLAAAYKKLSQQPLHQRPDGRVDVLSAAYSAANLQDCMNLEASRTYRLPSPPVSTYMKVLDIPFDVSVKLVGGTRLALRHREQ